MMYSVTTMAFALGRMQLCLILLAALCLSSVPRHCFDTLKTTRQLSLVQFPITTDPRAASGTVGAQAWRDSKSRHMWEMVAALHWLP